MHNFKFRWCFSESIGKVKQPHQLTEDGEVVVPRPAGEGDAAEEAAPLDRSASLPRMRRHDVHPGGVVGGVELEVGQEEPLAEGALERARRPRVPEDGAVLPPEARVDLVYSDQKGFGC